MYNGVQVRSQKKKLLLSISDINEGILNLSFLNTMGSLAAIESDGCCLVVILCTT